MVEVRGASNAESPKKRLDNVLGDFDESYDLDLLETLGLNLEPAKKAVEAVDGGRVTCSGSSPVEIEFQG